MKKFYLSIMTIALVFVIASCGRENEPVRKELPAVSVNVQQVEGSSTSKYVTASGKIEAENSVNISTRMMGYITSFNVKIGQKVKQGQLLATINSTDLLAKKAQVEASINQATTAYNSAKRDYDRYVILFNQKSATQKELDDITTHLEMTKASMEVAKQMRNEVMAQFAYTNITAPLSGVVTGTFAKAGDMANPGMPLMSIENDSKLQAVLMVSESDIANIRQGISVNVNVKSLNKTVNGKVVEVSTSAKNTGGQYIVKVNLDKNDFSILSGMFVNAIFQVEKSNSTQKDIVLLPQEAIVNQGQLQGVYVINENQTAILRWLRLGKSYGEQVEVLSGLSVGEKYIVSADGRLFNGSRVSVK
ncbi:MAG: efflux RND transporter periplasmic adaptor subunit [Chitinophagales bacterium]|nr:efflux RND transporter periplasmic adaptor subunit [Chitinophagales bacterium]MCZ2394030.1 efflux RND transporter periplasmic adaptor subunit [Chitinophagales bacterium]